MQAILSGSAIDQLMRAWRQDFHRHPETAYEEVRTSGIVAQLLRDWDIETHQGLAKTGVVGVLKGNQAGPMIGLRADMDALDILEANEFAHCSTVKGKMHACGHDGHTAMLLGAAKYLSEHRDFAGTAVFIFQPAEENACGGGRMIAEGLFEQFPVDAVFGMHNWPDLPLGKAAVHDDEVMASFDCFDIDIRGRGCHGAHPEQGVDSVAVAAQIISALQLVVSRNIAATDKAVLSVTQMHGGDMYNIIPAQVRLSGGTRSFRPPIRDLLESRIRDTAQGIAQALGAQAEVHYDRRYPPTRNHLAQARYALEISRCLLGAESVIHNPPPSAAAEDFAIMLEHKPGAYFWIGNGRHHPDATLHNPYYDFNDELLAIGASLWVALMQNAATGLTLT